MKCELCNSGQPEPGQRLCLPCIEAVARLWAIANCTTELSSEIATSRSVVNTKYIPIVAVPPLVGLL